MKLLVGLGNPEPAMALNRHNIGFLALDAIARRHGAGPWRARFKGHFAEAQIGGEKTLLLKPQTYMNLSGESVQAAAAFYKVALADIVVFHDELDLAPGRVRAKLGGGAAGHNGLRSIDQHCGQDYWRIRLGIGHPGEKARVTGHVLGDFAKADRAWLDPLLDAIAEAAPHLAAGAHDKFTTRVAHLTAPPKPEKPKPEKPKPETNKDRDDGV
ncbi:MAG: aminoacyl-tRNA hydrolase [Alphaproteobacteria bacterium]|nr:aminoacyl-tRNA hydrolase [Alphaproteobacteria bacterium]